MHPPARLAVRPAAALLALLLALTACSDDGGGEESSSKDSTSAEASTSTSPTGSASGSPTASATEAAEPEVPDPCQMVPEETWQELVPPKRRSHVVLKRIFTTSSGILISDSRVRYACAVTFNETTTTTTPR